jgi:putative phage-type endonuclease
MIDETVESFLSARAGGLGGTDMAAVVGLSPWKRPIDVFQGKIDPQGFAEPDKECLFWGSALEPIIRERYAIRYDVQVLAPDAIGEMFPNNRPWRNQTIVIGPEPWMLGTPDGLLPSHRCGLEIKCSAYQSQEWGKEGTDEIPQHYLVQVMWYMAVTGLGAWNIAVLFSGNRLQAYRVERNQELIDSLLERGRSFWNDNVLKQVPPAIDESESYSRYLARKFSLGNGDLIPETPDIAQWTTKLRDAQKIAKQAELDECFAKNHLADLIGEAGGCKTSLGKVGWVRPKNTSFTTDYKSAFAELSALITRMAPNVASEVEQIKQQFTNEKTINPYIRAWFAKGE